MPQACPGEPHVLSLRKSPRSATSRCPRLALGRLTFCATKIAAPRHLKMPQACPGETHVLSLRIPPRSATSRCPRLALGRLTFCRYETALISTCSRVEWSRRPQLCCPKPLNMPSELPSGWGGPLGGTSCRSACSSDPRPPTLPPQSAPGNGEGRISPLSSRARRRLYAQRRPIPDQHSGRDQRGGPRRNGSGTVLWDSRHTRASALSTRNWTRPSL